VGGGGELATSRDGRTADCTYLRHDLPSSNANNDQTNGLDPAHRAVYGRRGPKRGDETVTAEPDGPGVGGRGWDPSGEGTHSIFLFIRYSYAT